MTMMKNRSLPLLYVSAALLDAALAHAQAVPPAPPGQPTPPPLVQPRTAVPAPAPARPNPPPVVAPAAPPAGRPGAAAPSPLQPVGPGVVPSDLGGVTQRELPAHTPNLRVIEVQPGGL